MSEQAPAKDAIAEQLSYWKWDFTTLDLFSGELAYSLIFDNIRPDRVKEALATVGLDTLPNYFILIQIDDYTALSKRMEITREFFQKDLVVNTIRAYCREIGVPGFSANLINSERVLCFLCLDEARYAPLSEFFRLFVAEIRRRVHLHTRYTLSVSISERCAGLSSFPAMYTRVDRALDQSFYQGQEANLGAEAGAERQIQVDLQRHYTDLLAAVSQHSDQILSQRVEGLFQTLKEARLPPQQLRFEAVRLICRLEAYCVYCAVPEETVRPMTQRCTEAMETSRFINAIQEQFLQFCRSAAHLLERYSSQDYQFKLPVQAYISEHYTHPIRLEEIARAFSFNPAYFTQLFRRHFGMTLVQYLTWYRVQRSQELLTGSHIPLEEIAFQNGFSSYSYFCATFKRLTGITPGEFRRTGKTGAGFSGKAQQDCPARSESSACDPGRANWHSSEGTPLQGDLR